MRSALKDVLMVVLMALVLVTASACSAQQSPIPAESAIDTVIQDQNGAVIPTSLVSVVQLSTGVRLEGRADPTGRFVAANLAPGQYAVTAEHEGFKKSKETVDLGAHETRKIEIILAVGPGPYTCGPCVGGGNLLVEPIVSTVEPGLLVDSSIVYLPMGGGPTSILIAISPAQPKPRQNSIKRFFSSVGHKLGF